MNLVENLKYYSDKYWVSFRKLIADSFGEKYILRDKKFFNWQFVANPFRGKRKSTIKILLNKNEVIGCVGSVPLRLKVFNKIKKERCCSFSNLLVAKEYRSLGLGVVLIKGLAEDNDIMWGTGYKPELAAMYERIGGWRTMGDLKRYLKIINQDRVEFLVGDKLSEKSAEGVSNLSGEKIIVKKADKFDGRIEKFAKSVAEKYPITTERSEKFLNWRYSNHPYFKYKILLAEDLGGKILGYLVYRVGVTSGGEQEFKVGHILDLMAADCAVECLLLEVEKQMRISKVDFIDYFSTGNFHHKDLINFGYHTDSESFYDRIPMYLNPISPKRSNINFLIYCGKKGKYCESIFDPNNWYITKGDGDKDRPNPH